MLLMIIITLLLMFLGVAAFKLSWMFAKIGFMALLVIFLIILCCVDVSAHECTPSDIVMIGKVVQHEAGNQSELGKRLVIDTILNRVDSEGFPNTVEGVIKQPGQYCSPKKYPPDDIYRLVAEELYFRTNPRVLWYRTRKFHTYGVPIVQEGSHYFSGI